jgi:hypothetical protein
VREKMITKYFMDEISYTIDSLRSTFSPVYAVQAEAYT